jgi:alkylation response protein AidB-like acyl-CoA dehydrogenase
MNLFTDNKELTSRFERLSIESEVCDYEDNYNNSREYDTAPRNYKDAMEKYRRILEKIGYISGTVIKSNASMIDEKGNILKDNQVLFNEGIEENLRVLREQGFMGLLLPYRYGGKNIPRTIYLMAVEIVSYADPAFSNLFGLQDIADTILQFGNDEQKEKYLPRFADGTWTGAMALTEPKCGSNLQSISTTATLNDNGGWVLNGEKRFITNGCGDVLLVLARSEEGSKDARGLSLFLCERDDTIRIKNLEKKMGLIGSPTCEITFNSTPCQLIGKRGLGLTKYALNLMYGARIAIAAQALGICQAAYSEAKKYAHERIQFGKFLHEIPFVNNLLFKLKTQLHAARALLYHAASYVEKKNSRETALKQNQECSGYQVDILRQAKHISQFLIPLTKYFITENANSMAYDALQIHGGIGFTKRLPIERYYRDVRITTIYEGTSQMQVNAAIKGVISNVLHDHFDKLESRIDWTNLDQVKNTINELRLNFNRALEILNSGLAEVIIDKYADRLVDLYAGILISLLLAEDVRGDVEKKRIAENYSQNSCAQSLSTVYLMETHGFSAKCAANPSPVE